MVRYTASNMILHIHSDVSYLLESKARSRAVGICFISSTPRSESTPTLNGAIYVASIILKNALAFTTEVELAALLYNVQDAFTL